MKKRLLTIFSLFLLILPIAAGCGEDESVKVEVRTGIVRPTSMTETDVDYDVSDCAKIVSGGTYSSGENIEISVELNTKACKFYGWIENGVEKAISTSDTIGTKTYKKTITLDASVTKNYTIQAIVATRNPKSSKYAVKFTGVYKNNDSSQNILPEDITFPVTDNNETVDMSNITLNSSFNNGSKIAEALTGNDKANLNYIYVDEVFQPYKLQWWIADMDQSGLCQSSTWTKITESDPSTMAITKNMCLKADLIDDATNKKQSLNTAMNNMINSEIYLSTDSDVIENIEYGSKAEVPVSKDTFYAYKLANLNKVGKDYEAVYYGVNELGYLERVKSQTDGSKLYTFCRVENISATCDVESVFTVTYDTDDYKELAISALLDVLKSNNLYSLIDNYDVSYFYDSSINDLNIASFKFVDMDKYYVAIVDSKGDSVQHAYYNSRTVKFPSATSPKNAEQYTIVFEENEDIEEELETLSTKINTFHNSIQKYTSYASSQSEYIKEIETQLSDLIYDEINRDSNLSKLKNYIFLVKVDMKAYTITINYENAIIDLGTNSYVIDKYGAGENEYNMCPIDDQGLLRCVEYTGLASYVSNYLTKSLDELHYVKIEKDGNNIIYTIIESSGGFKDKITYDTSKKEFKDETDKTLSYVEIPASKYERLSEIKLIDETVLGQIVQTLTIDAELNITVSTKFNDQDFPYADGIETQIRTLYSDLLEATLYEHPDGETIILKVESNDTITMYELVSVDKDQGDSRYKFEIKYGENKDTYYIYVDDIKPANS